MRGQGQGGISTSCTLKPIRAEMALGTTAAEAHLTKEDLFMEGLPKGLELWEALNQEKCP